MKRKKTTVLDIAREAGVSQSTASMVLNKKKNAVFSEETVQRVMEAAEKLGYKIRPKAGKPGLSERSAFIAAVVPTISNPYYSMLIQAINAAAAQRGYGVFICTIEDEAETISKHLDMLVTLPIQGIIYTVMPYNLEPVKEIAAALPVLIVGDKKGDAGIDTIGLNSQESGIVIADHLLSLGHRSIAFISTPLNMNSLPRRQRLEGVKLALKNFTEETDLVVQAADNALYDYYSDSNPESMIGRDLALDLIEKGNVSAFIGVNDMVAYGILNAMYEKGLRIPQDYSVCGFDNIFPSSFGSIGLTTIENFVSHKGRDAVDILLRKIKNQMSELKPDSVYRVEYKPMLIVRGSTGAPRRDKAGKSGPP
jgi:LacI family transcriptional regulator